MGTAPSPEKKKAGPRAVRGLGLAAAVLLLLPQGCDRRQVPAATDGSPSVFLDAGTAQARVVAEQEPRAAGGVCDPECLAQPLGYGTLCVKAVLPVPDSEEPLYEQRCVACLTDEHCRQNPNAWAPRCDPERNLCYCEEAADCATGFPGRACLGTGMPEGPVCACGQRGPTVHCPPDQVCRGARCEAPCGPGECEKLCDPRRDSPTFGLCVECLTDADCVAHEEGFTCNRSLGDCGCAADADCAGHPNGTKCRLECIHHAGPASCWSYCACEDDGDCPGDQRCDEEWPRRCGSPGPSDA